MKTVKISQFQISAKSWQRQMTKGIEMKWRASDMQYELPTVTLFDER